MRWQFLRFYIGLVLVFMLGAVGLFLYGKHDMETRKVQWLKERSEVQLEMIRELLVEFPGSLEARRRELHKISRAVLHTPPPFRPGGPERGPRPEPMPHGDPSMPRLERLKDIELPEEEAKKLEAGEVVSIAGETDLHIFARVDSDEVLTLLRPLPTRPEGEHPLFLPFLPILIPLIILICIGTIIFLLIRPIERRMSALARVTEEFGEGTLSRRAQVGRTGSINELERSFNAMATRIEQLVTSQKDLLRAVSHDIRTPLSRIFFALDDAENAKSVEEKNTHLKRIDKALLDLTEMVNELLSFLRLDESEIKPDKRPLEVTSLLEHVPELVADLRPEITLETDYMAREVFADSLYLKRAVDNLLTNALRHARSKIMMSTCMENDSFHLVVDDDGPGIPKEEREKIFLPFYRLDKSRTQSIGGSGLGLAIVARIMQWQQGEVHVSDSPEGGARFTLILPCRRA